MESDCLETVLKIDAGVVAASRQWFPALFASPLCLLWLYEWYCSHKVSAEPYSQNSVLWDPTYWKHESNYWLKLRKLIKSGCIQRSELQDEKNTI